MSLAGSGGESWTRQHRPRHRGWPLPAAAQRRLGRCTTYLTPLAKAEARRGRMQIVGGRPRSVEHPAPRGCTLVDVCVQVPPREITRAAARRISRVFAVGPRNPNWTWARSNGAAPSPRARPRVFTAELSGFCVGLRLDQRGCRFPQSTAGIGSDQQTMTAFCDVSPISLRIRAGQN
jgi:hypothetical protein